MIDLQMHACDEHCSTDCQEGRAKSVVRSGGLTIDVHCHAYSSEAEKLASASPKKHREDEEFRAQMGEASVRHNHEVMLPRVAQRLMSVEQRLADMEAMGVDVQLISPAPAQYYYWADRELAEQLVRVQNHAIAALCQQYPRHFIGLGMVSLQHPDLAIQQLEYACETLGLLGVEVSTCVEGAELSDPLFRPFWKRCEELGAVIFIHPFASRVGDRLVPYYLSNVIGQPLETTLALSHLIFSGTLDRFPDLRILAAHGGGYLPHYSGRSDHGAGVRPECAQLKQKPSEYLRNIWFDSLVYNSADLHHLIQQVGLERVVLGTDYPFDMGFYDCHSLVRELPDLDDHQRQQILSANAIAMLQRLDLAILDRSSLPVSPVSASSGVDTDKVDTSLKERL